MRALILLFIFLILQGCNPFVKKPLMPPRDAIYEISAYGITLTTENRPFPEFLDVKILSGSPSYALPPLIWYFEPLPEYNQMDEINLYGITNGIPAENIKYTYLFLIEDEHSTTVIPSTPDEINSGFSSSYSGKTRVSFGPRKLVKNGNFIMTGGFASIPLTATHIEVMVQFLDSNENTSIAKVSLDRLAAWNKYIEPLIPLPN